MVHQGVGGLAPPRNKYVKTMNHHVLYNTVGGENEETDTQEIEYDDCETEAEEIVPSQVTKETGPGLLETQSLMEILTFQSNGKLCVDPQIIREEVKEILKTSRPKKLKSWERMGCAPPYLFPYLEPVANIKEHFFVEKGTVENV